ncbi:hypothetical protein LCGC14_1273000 [marine sediment metagenome]|uniref:Uncharacterized protein n=1 Tax=marine sediment metagenome TaxID=412755 RepID=A0A0F9KXG3_9ZZZZ
MKGKQLVSLILLFSVFFICVVPFGSAADYIIIVRPREGQIFTVGNNLISWEPPEDLKSVKIDLYKNRQLRKNLDMYTKNDGEYIWHINRTTDHFVDGDDYQIKITGIAGSVISGMSSRFSIVMGRLPFKLTDANVIAIVIGFVVLLALIVLFYERKTHKIKRWRERVKASIRKRKRIKKYKRIIKERNNN